MARATRLPELRVQTHGWRYRSDVHLTGSRAKLDEDGDLWLHGRVADVVTMSGHRISAIEVQSALVSPATVAEQAVIVGATDP